MTIPTKRENSPNNNLSPSDNELTLLSSKKATATSQTTTASQGDNGRLIINHGLPNWIIGLGMICLSGLVLFLIRTLSQSIPSSICKKQHIGDLLSPPRKDSDL